MHLKWRIAIKVKDAILLKNIVCFRYISYPKEHYAAIFG